MKIKLVTLLFWFFSLTTFADEYVFWEQGGDIAVMVPLVKGADKKIVFDEPVTLGVPSDFKRFYRPQIVESVVYLTPLLKTDKKHRVFAKGLTSNRTYILVVENSSSETAAETLIINIKPSPRKRNVFSNSTYADDISEVNLVRYASQNLYAPKHAIENLKGVKLVGLALPSRMDWIYEGSILEIKPIVSYKSSLLTVTAFEIKNKNPSEPISIDVMKIFSRVEAVSAVVQHEVLGVRGSDNKSALYIVTEGTLASKLKVRGQ